MSQGRRRLVRKADLHHALAPRPAGGAQSAIVQPNRIGLGWGTESMAKLDWDKLLSTERFSRLYSSPSVNGSGIPGPAAADAPPWLVNSRTETERDHDRVVYASPVRRLADKTQVFPLERNDSVRTRLTHSHEVSNLARSIGVHLVNHGPLLTLPQEQKRNVPAMLAAIGLAHDLGNPPFGHNGEEAIRSWVKRNYARLFDAATATQAVVLDQRGAVEADLGGLNEAMKNDFLQFEGNAQTLRVVTRLQVLRDDLGLNLTFGSLAALMKYTVGSTEIRDDRSRPARKKVGYFYAEKEIAAEIFRQTGLEPGLRHPLAYVMEACDDIAYSVIDAEDSVKKQLASFADLLAWLESFKDCNADELTKWVVDRSREDHEAHRRANLSSAELNDVSMQKFRVHAIHAMVSTAIQTFQNNYADIMSANFSGDLMANGKAAKFCAALKAFDRQHGYRNRGVLELELVGYNALHDLMEMLWRGITDRVKFEQPESKRNNPFSVYAYSRISENYRRIFENTVSARRPHQHLPIRYRELLLLTDMVSGMTDSFALDLCGELRKFYVGASAQQA